MSLQRLLNRPCTVTSRSDGDTDDGYGNPVPEEHTVTTVCDLQQQTRTEPGEQGEMSDTRWLLILPAGTAIDTAATVTVDGNRYEVVGDPWPARNPRTRRESHIEATVRRTS